MANHRTAAIVIERRAIAIAVFVGQHLDYSQCRQLSSSALKGESSAIGFINWLIETFEIESVALELNGEEQTRRGLLRATILDLLRSSGIPVWECTKRELLESYALPALRTRTEMREVIISIWPILNSRTTSHWILDAAALGLYVQTQRIFQQ